MYCTMSLKETDFLELWPQIVTRSTSGRKLKWIASFAGSKLLFGFFCICTSLHAKGKIFQIRHRLSTEFWPYVGIGEKLHQWLSTLVAGRSELLLLRRIFKESFFRAASCCFYAILPFHIYLRKKTFPFSVKNTKNSNHGSVSVFGDT